MRARQTDPNDVFRAAMTARYDSMKASIRDLIRRNGDAEMCKYAARLMKESMASTDAGEILKNTLALVGLCDAWLALMDEES